MELKGMLRRASIPGDTKEAGVHPVCVISAAVQCWPRGQWQQTAQPGAVTLSASRGAHRVQHAPLILLCPVGGGGSGHPAA